LWYDVILERKGTMNCQMHKKHDTEHSKIRIIVEHTATRIKNLEQWIVSE
jgi:hypothetical protein